MVSWARYPLLSGVFRNQPGVGFNDTTSFRRCTGSLTSATNMLITAALSALIPPRDLLCKQLLNNGFLTYALRMFSATPDVVKEVQPVAGTSRYVTAWSFGSIFNIPSNFMPRRKFAFCIGCQGRR